MDPPTIMISAVVLAFDASLRDAAREKAAARTLAALVEACVEGLVADAILVGPPDSGLGPVAEEAGCGLIEAIDARSSLARALPGLRYPHVLALRAGYAPERGFVDELRDAFALGPPARALALRAAPHSLPTRLVPRLAEIVGLLARREDLRAAGDLSTLARRLRAAELTTRARRTM